MAEAEQDDTRDLIKEILKRKDPAIVGLRRILSSKEIQAPGQSFQKHVPEVFSTDAKHEEIAEEGDALLTLDEQRIVETEGEILDLRSQIEQLNLRVEEAHQAGIAEGYQQAQQEVEERMAEEFVAKLGALNEQQSMLMAETVGNQLADRSKQIHDMEPQLLNLVLLLTRKVTGEEVSTNPAIIEHTIARAVRQLAGRAKINLRVAPEDYDKAKQLSDAQLQHTDSILSVEVEASPTIAKGGCLIETDTGIIDATIETQLAEIEKIIEDAWQEFRAAQLNQDAALDNTL